MSNQQRYKNTVKARRTKTRKASITSMLAKPTTLSLAGTNCAGWYKQRQRFSQRLYSLSGGKIILRTDYPFSGINARNWIQAECEHVFISRLKEIFTVGADKICPFCHIPDDLSRCGSIEAVQQNVESLSFSNIEFLPENVLGSPDDLYSFSCLIHHFRFEGTYRQFIQAPEFFCHICAIDNGK